MIKKRSAGHAKTSTIEVSRDALNPLRRNPCRLQAIALPALQIILLEGRVSVLLEGRVSVPLSSSFIEYFAGEDWRYLGQVP